MPSWSAEIAVDAASAARAIAGAFPELAQLAVEPIGEGWDNAAFLVGGRLVFRFPRRQIAVPLIEREARLLPRIAPALPLAIPVPAYVGAPSAHFPWPFAGYERIGGTTACALAFRDEQRAPLAEPLAAFARALHAIDPAPLVAAGLPLDELGRLDAVTRTPLARERLAHLAGAGTLPAEGADRIAAWLEAHGPRGARVPRVVHGDLYARHLLLDGGARLTGVIDWGDLHLGDPAIDLPIAFLVLPASAHGRFRAAYGAIDDATWEAARYRALYHAVLELDYGVRTGDAGMRRIGEAALRLMDNTP